MPCTCPHMGAPVYCTHICTHAASSEERAYKAIPANSLAYLLRLNIHLGLENAAQAVDKVTSHVKDVRSYTPSSAWRRQSGRGWAGVTSFLHLVMGQQALLRGSSMLGSQPCTRDAPGDQSGLALCPHGAVCLRGI